MMIFRSACHAAVSCLVGCITATAFASGPSGAKKIEPAAQPAVEKLDLQMYSRIRDEGFNHSHVMDYAGVLFDDIGPRLTGSPSMSRANEWTRAQLVAMGCSNAHLESWGDFGMAWTQIGSSLQMVKPSTATFVAQATPWSPATNGIVTADVITVGAITKDTEFADWKGKLKGKVILYGQASVSPDVDPDKVPEMQHYDDCADLCAVDQAAGGPGRDDDL